MPKITAHAKLYRDWEALLGACDKNAGLLAGMEPLKTEMEGFLVEVRTIKLQQENLDGTRKAVTQQLKETEDRGVEMARRLRAFVTSRIGTKTELGKMFGLVPTGRKPKKAKAQAQTPPAPPQSVTAQPPNPQGGEE
jgi:phage terminase Nu1 subunit (DNA packaging protein)